MIILRQKEFAGARSITGQRLRLFQDWNGTTAGAKELAIRTQNQMTNISRLSKGKQISPKRQELIGKALHNRSVLVSDLAKSGPSSPNIVKHALPYKGSEI